MIQLPIVRRAAVVLSVFFLGVTESFNTCHARAPQGEVGLLPLSSALEPVTGEMHYEDNRTTVNWKGRDYPCGHAVSILMELVVSRETDTKLRAEALQTMRRVPRVHVRNRESIDQLMSVYDRLHDRQEKIDLLFLVSAWSPRTLPFLASILEKENDKGVRLQAAAGLAAWNVRRGVAKIMELLDECRDMALADRTVCNETAKIFFWLNARKGWDFREDDIRKSIQDSTGKGEEEKAALLISELQKWWVQNEHRFPDWKPGDPLPEK